jgi:hypothetical protein
VHWRKNFEEKTTSAGLEPRGSEQENCPGAPR